MMSAWKDSENILFRFLPNVIIQKILLLLIQNRIVGKTLSINPFKEHRKLLFVFNYLCLYLFVQ